MTYWQLASGDSSRDYSQVLLDFGVACVGPGKYGSCHQDTWRDLYEFQNVPTPDMRRIARFLSIEAGDRIIMKSGKRIAIAIGEVLPQERGIYEFARRFDDVDGWDLQHCIRVKWKPVGLKFNRNVFDQHTISEFTSPTFTKLIEAKARNKDPIEPKGQVHDLGHYEPFHYEALERILTWQGIRIADAENVSQTIRRTEKLAKWYLSQAQLAAGEHEIRTFLVVPLLEALGWSPQQIRIEKTFSKKKLDLVLYARPSDELPCVLIETKRMYQGSANAIEQAKEYIRTVEGLKHLQVFIVTDGVRYWRYDRVGPEWMASAYMNFEIPRPENLAYPGLKGMYDLLISLHVSQFQGV